MRAEGTPRGTAETGVRKSQSAEQDSEKGADYVRVHRA